MIAPAALASAVEDALAPLGVTIDELPMTPERLATPGAGGAGAVSLMGPRPRCRGRPAFRSAWTYGSGDALTDVYPGRRDVCSPRFRDRPSDAAGRVRRRSTRSSRAGTSTTRPSRQRTTGTSCRSWVRIALRTARFNASSIRLPSLKIRPTWLELLVLAFMPYLCPDAMPDLGRLDRHRPGSHPRRDEPWGVRRIVVHAPRGGERTIEGWRRWWRLREEAKPHTLCE
jgi:hypothetical protein